MDIFKLIGSIFIKTDDADKGIDSVAQKAKGLATTLGTSMSKAGKAVENVGKKFAPISAVAGAVLGASVKSASDFTDAMAKVSTLVDTSVVSIDDLSKTFLDLSNATGKSATELAEAGYQALSASVPVEKLGKFTETATNLAKVGFTSASASVDILTTAINAYGLETEEADSIANKLVKTQNLGKTTIDELASSMGKIIPTASGMGVNIDNLTTGYVTLTKQGIATAEATTYMNSMLNELGDSGTDVGGILKESTGKSFQELMADGASLGDVLKILKDHADANGTAFNELWGSAEAGKSALAIVNSGTDEFNSTLKTMQENTDEVGTALEKLNTPSQKVKESLNRVKNSGIQLGTAFLTALAPTLDKIVSGVEKVTTWFNNLDEGTKTMIATILGIVAVVSPVLIGIGKVMVLVGQLIPLITQIGTVIAGLGIAVNPIGLIVGAVSLLAVGFVYLWNTSEGFREFWINLWNIISTTVINIVSSIGAWLSSAWSTIISTAVSLWNSLSSAVSSILSSLRSIITSVWNTIRSTVTNVMNGIKSTITTVWNSAKSAVTSAINGIKSTISSGLNSAKSTVTNIFNSIKSKITSVMNGAKSAVTSAISAIRGAFNFSWSLPHLALPHISISGGFSINPPSVPHFGISWYKKAVENPYLFTEPTVFGINPVTGQAKGAGEAQDEIMYGHQNLMDDIRNASGSAELAEALDEWMGKLFDLLSLYLPDLKKLKVVLDSGTLVGELAPALDEELGIIADRRDRWN